MVKKNFKIFLVLVIMTSLFMPFISVNASEPQKGDLRCPTGSDNCQEIKDKNGNVVEVRVTKRESLPDNNYIEIVKIVKKTNVLGEFSVSFKVSGSEIKTVGQKEKAYVMLIVDTSTSLEGVFDKLKSAAVQFSKQLTDENIYFSLDQFATYNKFRRDFALSPISTNDFCKIKGCSMGSRSFLGKALNFANNKFKNLDSTQKFVVMFGDGQYWYPRDTDWSDVKKWNNKLNEQGVRQFAIQFKDSDYYSKTRYNACTKYGMKTYGTCDTYYFSQLTKKEDYYFAATTDDYATIFKQIADKIIGTIPTTNYFSAELTDYLGEYFYEKSTNKTSKTFQIDKITTEGVTTTPFTIYIDSNTGDGWHDTNASFTLSYIDTDNKVKKITCEENPEVYWVGERTTINSCSGSIPPKNSLISSSTEYYTKNCQEGYTKNGVSYNGVSVSININNLEDGTKKFNIKSGLGFPSSIKLSTNVLCNYEFLTDKYNQDLNNILEKLKSETNPREIASLTLQKEELEKVPNQYNEMISAELKAYLERFKKQNATLKVEYANLNKAEISNYIDNGLTTGGVTCNPLETKTVAGVSLNTKAECQLSMSKNMTLPEVCLNMQTGEVATCSDLKYQIQGYNKFYVDLKSNGGQIFVEVSNLGIQSNLTVKLDDCSFDTLDLDLIYRQIENSDPFLQTYTKPQREIPKNYLNNKYNFVDIIKADIWDKKFNYRFSLSKVNVDNIKNDTNTIGANAYLGSDCYINSNYKYVCRFLSIKENNHDFFTKVENSNS